MTRTDDADSGTYEKSSFTYAKSISWPKRIIKET